MNLKLPESNVTHLVSRIETGEFGGATLRIGDLNGDGAPDLLIPQSIRGTREITCLTAITISGEILWQYGEPNCENGRIYSDLPVQIYDWDGDGHNEVLFVRQAHYAEPADPGQWYRERALRYEGHATMVVLDAKTGKELHSFPIPAAADDSFLFADLTGRGRRQDLVVKDRYWNLWGISHEGEELWHWEGSTGHYPAVADVDGDGRDEIFVGYALLDHDGRPLWEHDPAGSHSDANVMTKLPDGSWQLLYGNGGLTCLDIAGHQLWHHPLSEAQHVVAGNFSPELGAVQFAVINRGWPRASDGGPATLYLYNLDGEELWHRELGPASWAAICVEIDWSGQGRPCEVLVSERAPGRPCSIYNGAGEIVQSFPATGSPGNYDIQENIPGVFMVDRADVWGDSREEAILNDGHTVSLFANATARSLPTQHSTTHYRGI